MQEIADFKEKIQEAWKILGLDNKESEAQALAYEMEQPGFWQDQERAKEASQRADALRSEVETWKDLRGQNQDLYDLATDSLDEKDNSLKKDLEAKLMALRGLYEKLEFTMLFSGKHDPSGAIISIHTGTGGVDAQDWSEMLKRMLLRFCEKRGFSTRVLDESRGGEAGIKSVTFEAEGANAYGWLRSEHGVHRLVRISPFDAEALRQTSFALVEVLPIVDRLHEIKIKEEDLKIDTFRSSGHGGQSVNTTDSAVRITHVPTGVTTSCQNERSQYTNKRSALKVLQAKLQVLHEQNLKKEKEDLKGEHSQAQWGNQIRSYVLHPYKMVKDLRTRHEEPLPDKVLDGELVGFVEAYLRYDRERKNA